WLRRALVRPCAAPSRFRARRQRPDRAWPQTSRWQRAKRRCLREPGAAEALLPAWRYAESEQTMRHRLRGRRWRAIFFPRTRSRLTVQGTRNVEAPIAPALVPPARPLPDHGLRAGLSARSPAVARPGRAVLLPYPRGLRVDPDRRRQPGRDTAQR